MNLMGSLDKPLIGKFQDLIYKRFGIHYSREKEYLLVSKLEKLKTKNPGLDLQDFLSRLQSNDPEANRLLLREITVNHTFFFREESHFEVLVQDIKLRELDSPLIWCAASSTGEEPYSIVISLLENGINRFTIVSSDVDEKVLKAMNLGIFNEGRFSNTSRHVMVKYFKKTGVSSYQIRRELRQFLKIKRLNLHEDIHFEEPFDYVFCRNVMIYFDDVGRRKVVDNLVQNLKVGGLLFVGHTEALLNTPSELKKEGQSLFRRTS